ncbi:hypothetical protein L218DRAFT_1010692 [Marasmius fiardii PR-910]|nr:hypothetical protein L218DRAFT_1010692 [Marasmius fiardii PR-910]
MKLNFNNEWLHHRRILHSPSFHQQLEFLMHMPKVGKRLRICLRDLPFPAYLMDTSKAAQPMQDLKLLKKSPHSHPFLFQFLPQTITEWNDNQTVDTEPTPLRAGQSVS